MSRHFVVCALFLVAVLATPGAATYNNGLAVQYENSWYNTDTDGNGFVDHVNNSTEAAWQQFTPQVGPQPTGVYQWWGSRGPNNGTNGQIIVNGVTKVDRTATDDSTNFEDCTNFVTQALIAGGCSFSSLGGDTNPITGYTITNGNGGTLVRVRDLEAALRQPTVPVTVLTVTLPTQQIPSYIVPGDVIEWGIGHMSMVTSGSGNNSLVSYHSQDRLNIPVAQVMANFQANCLFSHPGNPNGMCNTIQVVTYHFTDAPTSYGAFLNSAPGNISFTAQVDGSVIPNGSTISAQAVAINVNSSAGRRRPVCCGKLKSVTSGC